MLYLKDTKIYHYIKFKIKYSIIYHLKLKYTHFNII
jgi:hypothetical protein